MAKLGDVPQHGSVQLLQSLWHKKMWSVKWVGSTSEFSTPFFPQLKYCEIQKNHIAGLTYCGQCSWADTTVGPLMEACPQCPMFRCGRGVVVHSREGNRPGTAILLWFRRNCRAPMRVSWQLVALDDFLPQNLI